MPFDTTTHGVFRIDGQWATSIGFRLHEEDGQTRQVDLRFTNDGQPIVKVSLTADQARALLGERNFANLHAASTVERPAKGQDPGVVTRSGRLHGESLAYREAVWYAPQEEPDNTLGPSFPERGKDARPEASRGDKLNARDALVGAAHAAQWSGVGGPALHGMAQAAGAVDAAKVAADIARGEDVRPIDAAAAAASVAMATGAGGPAAQAAAKGVAAVAAADTAERAANSAKDLAGNTRTDQAPSPAQAEDERRRRRALQSVVPDAVNQRFIRVKDEYYFADRTLAFTDHGGKLKSKSENLEVIRSLVAIAEAREWWSVTVSGSEQFRREVWRQGVRQGIDVHGYTPSDVERAQLRRSLGMPDPPANESPGSDGRATPTQERPASDSAARTTRQEPRPESQQVTGILLAHGAAPYRFDAAHGVSYHATLRTPTGEKTVWGIDLERAIVESQSGVKIGDEVTVENRGSAAVTIKVPKRDKSGAIVAHEDIATHRNSWQVETTAHLAQRRQAAQALRDSDAGDRHAAHSDPQLLNAMVRVWLSEQFAKRYIDELADRDRLVGRVKERLAQALERGETITAPQLRRDLARDQEQPSEPAVPTRVAPRHRASPEHHPEEPPYVHVQ